jgi:hypothetical protein
MYSWFRVTNRDKDYSKYFLFVVVLQRSQTTRGNDRNGARIRRGGEDLKWIACPAALKITDN